MDYSSFDKPKLWLNIAGFLLSGVMAGYVFHDERDIPGTLLFVMLAVNCLFRIFSYFKLASIRRSASGEDEIVRAERRQGIVIFIFSGVTCLLYILLLLIESILKPDPVGFILFCVVIALLVAGSVVLGFRNLKRFDRQ